MRLYKRDVISTNYACNSTLKIRPDPFNPFYPRSLYPPPHSRKEEK